MSLQVWLPLNGNLNNQGLSDLTFSFVNSSNTTIDNNGKIGQCYNNNSNTAGGLISNKTINLGTNQSMFCWINFTSLMSNSSLGGGLVSQHRYSSNIGMGLTIKYVSASTGYLSVNTGTGSARTFNKYLATTLMNAGTWYHVGYTYDGSNIKLYVNGVCEKTQAFTGMSTPADYLTVFAWSLGGTSGSTIHNNYLINGKLNDVRIYDHCLSSKEVEEISKGLVLHYKLDNYYLDNYFINPNLLLDTNVNGLTKVSASYNRYYESNGSGSYTCTWKAITDPPIQGINYGLQQKVTTVNGFHSVTWYQNGYVSVTAGTTYTMSCYVKVISGTDLSFKFQYGKSPYVANTQTLKNDNEWHQYSWTFTPNTASGQAAASGTTRIYCGGLASVGEVLICGWKLEEGNTATPWCETTYSPSNISNIVYDSSGYNNNGTIIDSLEIIFPSPRYNSAVQFNGSSSTIKVLENKWIAQYAQAMTINLWAKNTTWSDITNMKFFSCTESGGFNCETGNSGYIRFPIHVCTNAAQTSYAYKYDSKEIQASALIANEWNMITWVYDTSGTKTYINGQLHHTYTNTSYGIHFNTNARLFLGCEANTANPSTPYYNGQMSDFRMYYTALSPEAILELYNTSVTIDNKGNGYAREEIEDSNLNITKTGQFHNGELLDSNDYTTASITKIDKQLKVNNFYEY